MERYLRQGFSWKNNHRFKNSGPSRKTQEKHELEETLESLKSMSRMIIQQKRIIERQNDTVS